MEQLELADIQGIVAYAYLSRRHACYVLLKVRRERVADVRRWLSKLRQHVGGSEHHRGKRSAEPVVSIAFTHTGLQALGVNDQNCSGFVPEFQQGMTHPHRSRVLGDIDVEDNGQLTVSNAQVHWRWGADRNSVDILVSVYADNQQRLARFVTDHVECAVQEGAVTEVYRRLAAFRPEPNNPRDLREPFGFRDGISQPFVEGFARSAPLADAPENRVRAGEFVLGYTNELDRTGVSPSVSAAADPNNLLPALADGRRDFGRNGTYFVVRELDQEVEAFRRLDPVAQAKLIGRWPSGASLTLAPHGDVSALADRNDFAYFDADRAGMGCPIGSHVRRANPRDGFADPNLPMTTKESFASVNTHRLLRRGRPYQTPEHAGTFFICVNANIERQFEFVQQAWLNAPTFMGLNGERDMASGAATPFTIPYCAGRERLQLQSLIHVRGGAYFFLPSLRALHWLAGH